MESTSLFQIQDSDYSGSYSLHEALIAAATGAISGGGAYAFVSVNGVQLYLEDSVFSTLLIQQGFNLVVGIDQITNVPTLERLQVLQEVHDKFCVSAYCKKGSASIFHPKFSWFRKESGGTLVLGSGNLTVNGLRKNTEAFVVIDLDSNGIDQVEAEWDAWLGEIAPLLYPITDAYILERATQNQLLTRSLRARGVRPEAGVGGESQIVEGEQTDSTSQQADSEISEWSFENDSAVLVAEIPRSGNRWNQANFDIESFEGFFGATAGDNSQRIVLRNINSDGVLGEIEVRPSVSVSSQNYRFELEAAAGLDYPEDGRPIGVFIRVTVRVFLYILCMPGDVYYNEVRQFLQSNWSGREDRMKRIPTCVRDFKPACPTLPSW